MGHLGRNLKYFLKKVGLQSNWSGHHHKPLIKCPQPHTSPILALKKEKYNQLFDFLFVSTLALNCKTTELR